MNICFLSQEYPPETHVGGIGTYTFNMASALSRLEHTVHVITSTQHVNRTFQDNGVWVHQIKKSNIYPNEISRLYYSFLVARKIIHLNCQFDIIQASEYSSEAFWFSLFKKFPLITRLATPHFLTEELNGKVFWGPRPLFNWMEKTQTLYSDGIFSSTSALAKIVTKKWDIEHTWVDIIPNSVDLSRIVKLGERNSVPDILHNKDYLLFFGRLEERKGVRIIAQALPSVLKTFPNLNMVFIGSDLGYQNSSMREYIKKETGEYCERIIFFDNMLQEDLFPIVRLSRIVLLPSLWEAFGFVCIEAMALGRPVIATFGSGFDEIIEDSISGYLIKPGDSKSLTKKIIDCLKNEKKLQWISENSKKRVQDFDVFHVALKLLNYYKRIRKEWLTKT